MLERIREVGINRSHGHHCGHHSHYARRQDGRRVSALLWWPVAASQGDSEEVWKWVSVLGSSSSAPQPDTMSQGNGASGNLGAWHEFEYFWVLRLDKFWSLMCFSSGISSVVAYFGGVYLVTLEFLRAAVFRTGDLSKIQGKELMISPNWVCRQVGAMIACSSIRAVIPEEENSGVWLCRSWAICYE